MIFFLLRRSYKNLLKKNGLPTQREPTIVGKYLHAKEEIEVSEPVAKSCVRRGRK